MTSILFRVRWGNVAVVLAFVVAVVLLSGGGGGGGSPGRPEVARDPIAAVTPAAQAAALAAATPEAAVTAKAVATPEPRARRQRAPRKRRRRRVSQTAPVGVPPARVRRHSRLPPPPARTPARREFGLEP